MAFKFPFTNYHELNLNWVLKELKELFEASEENVSTIETYDERLTTVETELPTVSATAQDAAQNAAAASTAAQQATATANTAQENATQAQALAGFARQEAQAAQTAADAATQAAQQATATAQNFDGRITQAQNDASTALEASRSFENRVQAAITTANNAANTATNAQGIAMRADQNAALALDEIGDLSSLETEAKQNLVVALNEMGDEVDDLSRQISDVEGALTQISERGKNLLPVKDFEKTINNLNIKYHNGEITRNGTVSTDFSFRDGKLFAFTLSAGTYTFWSDNTAFNVAALFDKNDRAISIINSSTNGTFTLDDDTLVWFSIRGNQGSSYNNMLSKLQLESGSTKTTWEAPFETAIDVVARAKATENSASILNAQNNIITLQDDMSDIKGGQKEIQSTLADQMYNGAGVLQPSRTDMYYCQITLPSGANVFTVEYSTSGSNANHWYNEFDSSDNLIYSETLVFSGTTNTVSLHSSNVSYIKLSIWVENGEYEFLYTKESITSGGFSLISALGDSITNGYFPSGYVNNTYQKLIADRLEADFQKLGVNSTPICPNSDYDGGQNNNAFVYRYTQISSSADLIIVAGGTNDFRHNVPLGSASDTAARFEETFYGAVDYLITNIVANHIGAKLVFITPFHQINDTVANTAGYKLSDYINAIKEKCMQYGIVCIDGFSSSGVSLIPAFVSNFMTDSLHPNEEGHMLIYKNLMPFFAML